MSGRSIPMSERPILHPVQVFAILLEMRDEDAARFLAEHPDPPEDASEEQMAEWLTVASEWLHDWRMKQGSGARG